MKVLLYSDWPLAATYLDPVRRYIHAHEPSWEVWDQTPLGEPDVVICCDELSGAPDAPLKICIFHGLASKGQAFSTARREDFVNGTQLFAVAGPYYERLLLNLGVPQERIFIAGFTKFDGMQRNILYAPTHNPQLSAIPVVKDRIYEIPDVKVHLHQWLRIGNDPHQIELRSYYPEHEDREDIADLLQWADVIIGDLGSIIVEAIALGKQAIQVVNPIHESWYIDFRRLTLAEMNTLPEVYFPAKYGTRVYSFDELLEALNIVSNIGRASAQIVERIKQ